MKKLFVILAILGVAVFTIGDANAGVGLRSIGVGAGYASPENLDGTWSAGLYMDFGVPVTNLFVQPFVSYWSWEESASGLGSSSISDVAIGGNMKYIITTGAPKFHPYIQGGVAAHLMTADTQLSLLGNQSFSVTDTKVGFQAGAGAAFDMSERFSLFGQGSYHIIEDFNQWMVGGGVQINL